MKRHLGLAAVAACLFAAGAGVAYADECGPLKMYTSVDLVRDERDMAYAKAEVDGKEGVLLLDTGGVFNMIAKDFVAKQGLESRRQYATLIDINGNTIENYVRTSLKIGRMATDSVAFAVVPLTHQTLAAHEVIGILASDVLRNYDVELDFAANKMNLLSPDHCEGKVIYWPATALAVTPMDVMQNGHIAVEVDIEGKKIKAIIDTGASHSTMTRSLAERRFDLALGGTDTPQVDAALNGDRRNALYMHTFKSLGFEGIAISNLKVLIIPDTLTKKTKVDAPIGTRLKDQSKQPPEVAIGMDVLQHLHLYIAYKEEKLYITPSGK